MATYKHNKPDVDKWLSSNPLIKDGNGNGNGETEPTKKRMKFFSGKSETGGESKYDPKVKVEWHISASPIKEKKPIEEKGIEEFQYTGVTVPRTFGKTIYGRKKPSKFLTAIFGEKKVRSKSAEALYKEQLEKLEESRAEKGIVYTKIDE